MLHIHKMNQIVQQCRCSIRKFSTSIPLCPNFWNNKHTPAVGSQWFRWFIYLYHITYVGWCIYWKLMKIMQHRCHVFIFTKAHYHTSCIVLNRCKICIVLLSIDIQKNITVVQPWNHLDMNNDVALLIKKPTTNSSNISQIIKVSWTNSHWCTTNALYIYIYIGLYSPIGSALEFEASVPRSIHSSSEL